MKEITFIKLGGSLITNKAVSFCAEEQVMEQVIKEIKDALNICPQHVVIGHGGGSFPHVYASQYKINEGFVSENSYTGFCKVQDAAAVLNRMIVNKFLKYDMNAVSFQISNSCKQKNSTIEKAYLDSFYRMLEYNFIPVVYGDVAFDEEKGCSVISTEEIFRFICDNIIQSGLKYKIKSIILCGSVDGVLTADPNYVEDVKLIKRITSRNYHAINKYLGGAYGFDVTGGMTHKVKTMLYLCGNVTSQIINGRKDGQLRRAILGEHVGTLIVN